MFSQTFVDSAPRHRKSYAFALSSCLQALVLGLLALASLFYRQGVPEMQLHSLLLVPRAPTPPTQVTPEKRQVASGRRAMQWSMLVRALRPMLATSSVNSMPDAPDVTIAGTTTGAVTDSSLVSVMTGPPATAPAPAERAAAKPLRPVTIGGVVAEANLIKRSEPVYPALARAARVQGSVQFTAVISREGTVEKLQLVSGHPLLVQAAREAILQWRYRPTRLNGEAVEVVTIITVNFRLGG